MTSDRATWLRRGRMLAALTVTYNALEGVIAVVAGLHADSVALLGFGVDSFVEVTSALVVAWRMHDELIHDGVHSADRFERVEKRTARITGVLLMLLAGYLVVEAGLALAGLRESPESSTVGMVLTAVSATLMPILARAKLRAASALDSKALRADAFETVACVWLSVTTLVGLALNASFDLWWADPAAALLLVPLIVREGLEAIRGEDCCDRD